MRVAGDAADEPVREHRLGQSLRPAAEAAEEAALIHLQHDAAVDPVIQIVRHPLQAVIPLRMRHDRPIPGRKQLVEQALDAQRVFVKAELDEQVAPTIDRQQPPLAQKLWHVTRAEDLHTERELKRDARLAHGRAQAVKAHLQRRGCVVFKRAALIAVRRGDQMRHTGLRRHGGHQHRRLQIRCAVIDPRKNMCVQIDH